RTPRRCSHRGSRPRRRQQGAVRARDPARAPLMRLLAAALLVLALAAPALASEVHPTLNEMEGEVMCPICHTTLDESNSAAAQRIKAFIARRIRAGDTKSEIENRLVADFGPS